MKNKNKNANELLNDYLKASKEVYYINNYAHERCLDLLNRFNDIEFNIGGYDKPLYSYTIIELLDDIDVETKINIIATIEKHIESLSSKQLELF